MQVLGLTIVKYPNASAAEDDLAKLVETIKARESSLEQTANALSASISVQQDDLTRINAVRSKLRTLTT